MKRLITFFVLTLFGTLSATLQAATDYGIVVGGVRITSLNANNVTGGNIKSGTVKYEPEKKALTLVNANIGTTSTSATALVNESVEGLCIYIVETCNLKASSGYSGISAKARTSLFGDYERYTLNIESGTGIMLGKDVALNILGMTCNITSVQDGIRSGRADGNGTSLNLFNVELNVNCTSTENSWAAIQTIPECTMLLCDVKEPQTAWFSPKRLKFVKKNWSNNEIEPVKSLKIKRGKDLNPEVYVAGKLLNEVNPMVYTDELENGASFTYEKDTNGQTTKVNLKVREADIKLTDKTFISSSVKNLSLTFSGSIETTEVPVFYLDDGCNLTFCNPNPDNSTCDVYALGKGLINTAIMQSGTSSHRIIFEQGMHVTLDGGISGKEGDIVELADGLGFYNQHGPYGYLASEHAYCNLLTEQRLDCVEVGPVMKYDLQVMGFDVTDHNANDILGNNTLAFQKMAGTKSLFFDDAYLGCDGYEISNGAAIYDMTTTPLNIYLKGENRIVNRLAILKPNGSLVIGNPASREYLELLEMPSLTADSSLVQAKEVKIRNCQLEVDCIIGADNSSDRSTFTVEHSFPKWETRLAINNSCGYGSHLPVDRFTEANLNKMYVIYPEDATFDASQQTFVDGDGYRLYNRALVFSSEAPQKLGDISGDGVVDVSDYIGVANYILGSAPEGFNASAADVNKDGFIDVSDYIGIANIILTGNINGK